MFSELCFCVGSTRVSDEFCMLQAPYRVTGFIWHGHEHYVAYLLSGRRWHCLDDAVVSEVDVAALPSQACMVFLQKAVRLSQKVAGAGPRAAGRVPHPIWTQLPEVLAQAAMLPASRLGSFAKRVARKRAIRNGEQRSSSRQQQRSGKQRSGRPQKQRSGRPQKQRSGRPQKKQRSQKQSLAGRRSRDLAGRRSRDLAGRRGLAGRRSRGLAGRRRSRGRRSRSGRPQKQGSGRPQRSGRPDLCRSRGLAGRRRSRGRRSRGRRSRDLAGRRSSDLAGRSRGLAERIVGRRTLFRRLPGPATWMLLGAMWQMKWTIL